MGRTVKESVADRWPGVRARFERAAQESVAASMGRCEVQAACVRDAITAYQGEAADSLLYVSRVMDRYIGAVVSVADLVHAGAVGEAQFDHQGSLSQVGVLRQTFDVHCRMIERASASRASFMSGVSLLIDDIQNQLTQVVREGLERFSRRRQDQASSAVPAVDIGDGLLDEERLALSLLAAHSAQQTRRAAETDASRQEQRGQS